IPEISFSALSHISGPKSLPSNRAGSYEPLSLDRVVGDPSFIVQACWSLASGLSLVSCRSKPALASNFRIHSSQGVNIILCASCPPPRREPNDPADTYSPATEGYLRSQR